VQRTCSYYCYVAGPSTGGPSTGGPSTGRSRRRSGRRRPDGRVAHRVHQRRFAAGAPDEPPAPFPGLPVQVSGVQAVRRVLAVHAAGDGEEKRNPHTVGHGHRRVRGRKR